MATSVLAVSFCALPVLAQGSQTVRHVQQALQAKGYNPGTIDGMDGPHTRNALRQYQRHEHLTTNGQIDASTLSSLGIQPTPGEHFSSATNSTAKYKKAGSQYSTAGKKLVNDSSKGYVGAGAAAFGKHVGKGTKAAAVGTAHAAEQVGKGVKSAIVGKPKNENNNNK
ncbi:MAG: peptidoglycan-binding domain-containing protein [Bryobacteraceae bacterium]